MSSGGYDSAASGKREREREASSGESEKMVFVTFKHTHTKRKALKTIENKFDPGKHKNTYTNFGSNKLCTKLCTNRPSHIPRPPLVLSTSDLFFFSFASINFPLCFVCATRQFAAMQDRVAFVCLLLSIPVPCLERPRNNPKIGLSLSFLFAVAK